MLLKSFNINYLTIRTENTVTDYESLSSQLEEIRKSGVSLEDEELELGLLSIAVPIVKWDGSLFGTLSITGQAQKVRACLNDIVADMNYFKSLIEKELFSEQARLT